MVTTGGGVGVTGLVLSLPPPHEDRHRNDVNNRIIFFTTTPFSDTAIQLKYLIFTTCCFVFESYYQVSTGIVLVFIKFYSVDL